MSMTTRMARWLLAGPPMKSVVKPMKSQLADEAVSAEFLMAFVRRLVAMVGSGDVLVLAMRGAAKDVGATERQTQTFLRAVLKEQAEKSPWPKGFF